MTTELQPISATVLLIGQVSTVVVSITDPAFGNTVIEVSAFEPAFGACCITSTTFARLLITRFCRTVDLYFRSGSTSNASLFELTPLTTPKWHLDPVSRFFSKYMFVPYRTDGQAERTQNSVNILHSDTAH